MAGNKTLAAAILALTNAIALIQRPTAAPPVFDPFSSDQPFNLSIKLGSQAYADISAPLEEI